MRDLYGKCGNNCGHCALYHENLTDGCQSEEGFLYLKNCAVRMCAKYNGAENCAYCTIFPCQYVPSVSLPADYRDRIAERLGSLISEDDYLAFIDPYEGMAHLEAIRASLAPESLIEPRPVAPIRTRMAAFPENLPLSEDDEAAYRSLYGLLKQVLTAPVDLYVRQMKLKARRKETLNLLWVFGRYGEFDEGGSYLVIDGPVSGAEKPFSNIVRKRDNALHTSTAESTHLLQDFGVTTEYVALGKKDWQFKMWFADEVGGISAMGTLKRYVASLITEYGEPEYAGASRYKGEAYARFSRADVQVLAAA